MADRDGRENRVISVERRLREARFPVQGKLETYWQRLRGSRLVPARADIDPRAIDDCLEYAFIGERIAPGIARFRLAGMHLNDLMGMEVRGMPMTCFFPPADRRRMSDVLEEVFEGPALARMTLRAERGLGRPAMEAELSLMPLLSDFGDVTRVLGALTSQGVIGRAPRRFHIVDVRVMPLAAHVEGPAPSPATAPAPSRDPDPASTGASTGAGTGTGTQADTRADSRAAPGSERRSPQPGFAELAEGYTPPGATPEVPRAVTPPRVPDGSRPRLYVVKSND